MKLHFRKSLGGSSHLRQHIAPRCKRAILIRMAPLIGITADSQSVADPRSINEGRRGNHDIVFIKKAVTDAVTAAGGLPVIVPFAATVSQATATVKNLGGLIISGGNFDIDPSLYGEKRHKKLGAVVKSRTVSELLLLKTALKMKKPVLGICGGHQLINVHFGGTLYQDILSQNDNAKNHEQKSDPRKTSHTVNVQKGSRLSTIVRRQSFRVNSTHHQAVKKLGRGLTASGCSPDGIVEALEAADGRFIISVQWHPEFLTRMEPHLNIFKSFIKVCAGK